MPAAKKSTNTKQKQSLISKLKLNTLKGRILATVLVFAVIGGGLAVYKSFAYAPNNGQKQTFTYNVAAGTLRTDLKPALSKYNSQSPSLVTATSKNNIKVVKLPGRTTSEPTYASIHDSKWGVTIPKGQVYDWCATLKGYFNGVGGFMHIYRDASKDVYGSTGLISAIADLDGSNTDVGGGWVIRCSKMKYTAQVEYKGPFFIEHDSRGDGYVASVDLRFY